MQSSTASYTIWYKIWSSLLLFKTKKSIPFLLKNKWSTSFYIQRNKTILQHTFTTRSGQPSQMLSPHPTDGRFKYKSHAILLKGNLRIVSFWKAWLQTGNQRTKQILPWGKHSCIHIYLCSTIACGPPMAPTAPSTHQDWSGEYSRWCVQTVFFKRWRSKNRLHALPALLSSIHPFPVEFLLYPLTVTWQ